MLNKTHLARIDLNLLVLFEAVLEERHVARAAARLNVSPSAVSHGLKRLRQVLHDPLFLRNPKGVVPTERATLLAAPIADILARTRNVMASAEPFDAAKSSRRFVLGAPDGVSAVLLPPLLAHIRKAAPGINLAVKNLMGHFESALTDLDERTLDVAIVPLEDTPARFAARVLYEEDFVIVKRAGHRLGNKPSLERYCAASHLVVSIAGDPHGLVDRALEPHGLTRRVALTVPNFMLALAIVSESDLIAAMPRRFVGMHAGRYAVTSTESPVPLHSPAIRAITPRVATMDAGLVWLLDLLERTAKIAAARGSRG